MSFMRMTRATTAVANVAAVMFDKSPICPTGYKSTIKRIGNTKKDRGDGTGGI